MRGGYRGIDRADVHFPFGHGLGYATFELEVLEVTAGDVTAVLKHVSGPGGSAVVQVYGSEPSRLLAFEKRFLDEGDEDVVSLRFHGSVSEVAVGFSSGEATTYAVQGGAGDGFRRDLNWWVLVIGPPILVFSIIGWLLFRDRKRRRAEEQRVERAPALARADGDVPARRLRRGRRVLLDTAGRGEAAVCLTLPRPIAVEQKDRAVLFRACLTRGTDAAFEQKNQPHFCSSAPSLVVTRKHSTLERPLERRHARRDADLVHGALVERGAPGVGARDGRLERRDGVRSHDGAGRALVAAAEHALAVDAVDGARDVAHRLELGSADAVEVAQAPAVGS